MKREFGVFIGRFQPFHNAHLQTVRHALTMVEKLVIIVGSDRCARSPKNPWTGGERVTMITNCLSSDQCNRVLIERVPDYLYNDNLWIAAVQEIIARCIDDDVGDVVLFGHKKDASSFYLKLFPRWELCDTGSWGDLDASHVRDLYFQQDFIGLKHLVPDEVLESMLDFSRPLYGHKQLIAPFALLKDEYDHLRDYRRLWEGAPFPPTFVTVDAVVVCSGHVLVVRRRSTPGKGLLALPGGFLNPRERIVEGAIRELKEETAIKLTSQELESMIVDEKVFDHPDRSLRGRTITHAFCVNVNQKQSKLPQVKGMDDADKAFWLPLSEVFAREDEFFEDHAAIVRYFVSRY